jgi:transcriptional regulator
MLYQPSHFRVDDPAHLLRLMAEHPLATLLSVVDGEPQVSHVPLMATQAGDRIELMGHVAGANPQGRAWIDGARVLAIFHGPSAYVAPRWYTVREAVPTWNYVVVHAHGSLRRIDDSDGKEGVLKQLIDGHDRPYRAQWDDELSETYRERMKRGILAFRIEVDRLDGKFKLSQNRSPEDQQRVRAAMAAGDGGQRGLAGWMATLGFGDPA